MKTQWILILLLVLSGCGVSKDKPRATDDEPEAASAPKPLTLEPASSDVKDNGRKPVTEQPVAKKAADEPQKLATVHYFGRFDTRDPESPACAWSNCGAGVRFSGKSLGIKLSGAGSITFQVVLDGALSTKFVTFGNEWGSSDEVRTYQVAENVSAGPHDVQIYRNPEAMFGVVKFHGFEVEKGQLLESPFPFNRKIEIIGDSVSAGYGNDGCPFSAATEIGSAAYGALAARKLNAIAHVVAWSGKGLVMNSDGTTDDVIPELYGYTLPQDKQTSWNFSSYVPDAIVVNLGINDFSNSAIDRDRFIGEYINFVRRLRGYYPAGFILLATNTATDQFSDEIDEVIGKLADGRVEKINLNTPNMSGCDSHPNLAAHESMANTLAARLRTALKW